MHKSTKWYSKFYAVKKNSILNVKIEDLFGVTVDYIINEHTDNEKALVVEKKKISKKSNLLIKFSWI